MTTDSPWTWGSIIDAIGGTMRVVEGLGESKSTVSGWRSRPRGIPGEHWAGIVRLAAEAGNPEITLEVLAEVAERRQSVTDEARA
ncbi:MULTISPECIES: helix-turn-helix domain-containing protein [unclassified Bradyrhizobium]|uniref:helix-turn-helix domain-containing protein n=1 Tax=unclassified Bradyrhizobium TaxID=2631580 RepID=UPI001FFB0046|nr:MULTISPECIES: helix-turn-helix domain-containing protein [unclassified Bradyrhizobium]MCK1568943.1 hypothetical protein [Bradyrhizobium sp. 173]MCK1583223.1 hypothetical protein [Bradyrhizobium sp. 168]MCK1676594.1 hypothetical protein [Bradyrhizobium sp. 150]